MTQGSQVISVRSFRQTDFDCFAQLSGDDNPIHVDSKFAAQTQFGRTVAHGVLLCSVLRGLIENILPGGRLIEQSVMFPAPTFADEPMRFVVSVNGRSELGSEVWFDCCLEVIRVADGVVTCQGNTRVVL